MILNLAISERRRGWGEIISGVQRTPVSPECNGMSYICLGCHGCHNMSSDVMKHLKPRIICGSHTSLMFLLGSERPITIKLYR